MQSRPFTYQLPWIHLFMEYIYFDSTKSKQKASSDTEKNLYIPKKLESTFVELIIKGKKKYYYRLHLQTS